MRRGHVHNVRINPDRDIALSGFIFLPMALIWHGRKGLAMAILGPLTLFGLQWGANAGYSQWRCTEAARMLPPPIVEGVDCDKAWTCHPLALELARIDAATRNAMLVEECRARRPIRFMDWMRI